MVDKRSLRSSKKETQETPAEQEQEQKPKPTRTRSGRSRKKNETASEEPSTSTSASGESGQVPSTTQSEDVVMATESVPTASEKGNDDVEMKGVETDEKKDDVVPPKEDTTASPLQSIIISFSIITNVSVIKQNLQLLERAVNTSDPRFTYRVLKMSNLRKKLSAEILVQVIREVYPPDHPSVSQLLSLLDKVEITRSDVNCRNPHQWKLMRLSPGPKKPER